MSDYYQRRQEIADRIDLDLAEGTVSIVNGWLVENVHEHTCGTGLSGHYGRHEPGCGQLPIFDIVAAIVRANDEVKADDWAGGKA